jgi:hypothetical protein
MKKTKKPKFWIYKTVEECVLCGSSNEYRKRMYTPKPKDPQKRNDYNQYACSSHFI